MKIYADWIYDYIVSHNGFLALISPGPHLLFFLPYILNFCESLLFYCLKVLLLFQILNTWSHTICDFLLNKINLLDYLFY